MSDQYDATSLQRDGAYATKEQVHAAYADFSDGEKSAFNKTVRELHEWRNDPDNAWFGASITPLRIEGKIRELSRNNGLDPELMFYVTTPNSGL